jgi:pilus assembly protein CpaB
MRTNTLIMLLIAIVFGSIAVFLANVWLTSQNRMAAVAPAPEPVETSTLVVASTNLTFGAILKPETLREIAWPKNALPDGAFATIAEITAEGRRVVLMPVGPNEPILKWKISGPDARASLSALVAKGMRAVAIRVNDVVGVAGFILPGDRVDVLYTRGGGGNAAASTDILIQNVRILAIDQLVDEKTSQPAVAKVVTIEVNTTDAQKIALAQTTGSLSLTLRSAGSLDQAPAQRIVEQELTSSTSVYEVNQAALNERLSSLQSTFADLGKSIEAGDSDKAALVAKLSEIERKLRIEIANAGNDDPELRAKLAVLEAAIRQTKLATGQSEEALRAKLAEFEATLRRLAEMPSTETVEELPVTAAEKVTATVGVTRGTARQSYEVPLESATE